MPSKKLFYKGIQALDNNDYLLAEKYFLASLYLSNQDDDYLTLLGSIDKLSLYVYSKGYYESKERAMEFYKIVSEADENASYGYFTALVNGCFCPPDYEKALKQLSKAYKDDKIFGIAFLLSKADSFGIDNNKAGILFKYLVDVKHHKEYEKFYTQTGSENRLSDAELKERVDEILNQIFKGTDQKIERINKNHAVTEFFNNPANIPDFDTLDNLLAEDAPVIPGSDDNKYQLRNLKAIYNAASFAPVFHHNLKYSTGKFAELTPYIAYSDVLNDKYIIRGRQGSEHNSFDDEKRDVIAEYSSLEKLVNDGWRLD